MTYLFLVASNGEKTKDVCEFEGVWVKTTMN